MEDLGEMEDVREVGDMEEMKGKEGNEVVEEDEGVKKCSDALTQNTTIALEAASFIGSLAWMNLIVPYLAKWSPMIGLIRSSLIPNGNLELAQPHWRVYIKAALTRQVIFSKRTWHCALGGDPSSTMLHRLQAQTFS